VCSSDLCSVMPDHVHLVIQRHKYAVEQVVRRLKQEATIRLREGQLLDTKRTVWARSCWKSFLFNHDDFQRSITYVENNPIKAGFKPQCWSFVRSFNGLND